MNCNEQAQSIGIFDSGVGGLTVMRAIIDALPNESITYFGDTARLPYGEKSADTILRFSIENAQFLLEKRVKALIIACNTACSTALEELKTSFFSLPIIGVTEAAPEKIQQLAKPGNIAILGTRRTILSGIYQQKLQDLFPEKTIIAIPCPLFVPIVEEGFFSHPLAKTIVKEYLSPLKDQNITTILLGCTHYPLLRKMIAEQMGPGVSLIDPAVGCAELTTSVLKKKNLLNPSQSTPHYTFYVSDDTEKFQQLGEVFLNRRIEYVSLKT